jgi:hypothetical protein
VTPPESDPCVLDGGSSPAIAEPGDRLEAEPEAVRRVLRERFEQTEDPEAQAELATLALEQVERQLQHTRERRRDLDAVEGELWSSRNRLERFLIGARGPAWWHSRRRRF